MMGLLKWFEKDELEEYTPCPVSKILSYDVANLQEIGMREWQEDSFAFVNALDVSAIRQQGLMAIVADGMGGLENGKVASDTAVRCLVSGFKTMDREKDMARQLKDCVLQANDMVFRQFGGYSGTTVIACIFYKDSFYFASVGDSYLYLKRGNWLYRLNREQNYLHQLYLEQIRHGVLNPMQAREDPDAHRLSQFVGMDNLEDIDYVHSPFSLQAGDSVLVCSDGVGGVLDEEQVYTCLCGQTAGICCKMLNEEIRQENRKYQDNYTALVISCNY